MGLLCRLLWSQPRLSLDLGSSNLGAFSGSVRTGTHNHHESKLPTKTNPDKYRKIYLEPKWLLFWLEKTCFGGFNHQNRGQTGSRYNMLNQFASSLRKEFPTTFHFCQVYVLSLIDNGLDDVTGIAMLVGSSLGTLRIQIEGSNSIRKE